MQNRKIKLELKKFSKEHLDNTFLWMQNHDLKRNFLIQKNITRADHGKWYQDYCKDLTQKIYAIFADNIHIGNIGLKYINFEAKSAETWIYIGNVKFHGLGLAYDSYILLFELLSSVNIESVCARIASFNEPSQKLYQRLGFTRVKERSEIINFENLSLVINFYEKSIFDKKR